jgi:hypothetical protein
MIQDVLTSLVRNAVTLSTNKGRLWHRETWNPMVLTSNPFIILTMLSHMVREQLCLFFSNDGHVVLPAGEDVLHLITGHPKPNLATHAL